MSQDTEVLVQDNIQEVAGIRKMVVRNGKVVAKIVCPDGYGYDRKSKKCKKITAAQKIASKKSSKQATRTRKQHAGINRIKGAKSRRKSLKIRTSRNVAAKAQKVVS